MRFACRFPVCPGGAISRTSLLCFNDLSKTAQHRSRLNPEIAVDRDRRPKSSMPTGPDAEPGRYRRADLRAHPRPRRSGGLHQPARRGGRHRRGEGARRRGRIAAAALRRAGRDQGQHRRRRACRPPPPARPSPTQPRTDATCVARLRARRRDRHRQDQPRSVRDRPGRRALALWHAAQRRSTRT